MGTWRTVRVALNVLGKCPCGVAVNRPRAVHSVIRMHWHKRFHEDSANMWLRGLITGELGSD